MVIRHSLLLLEQLHELEREIRAWEEHACRCGCPLDNELLTRIVLLKLQQKNSTSPLTGHEGIS